MFRKIISQLPFSPALIVELSEYAKKVGREEKLRLAGLVMVIILVALQIIIALYPPPAAKDQHDAYNKLSPSLNIDEASASIDAVNLTQGGVDATSTKANPNDKIIYSLYFSEAKDPSSEVAPAVSVNDLLEYATLSDLHGGTLDEDSNILYWSPVELESGEMIIRSFSATLNNPLSPNPRLESGSFDCNITVDFAGNINSINLQCPPVKWIEYLSSILPRLGSSVGVQLSLSLLVIAIFLYARSRQLRREIKIIRHNLNTGGDLL